MKYINNEYLNFFQSLFNQVFINKYKIIFNVSKLKVLSL